MKNENISFLSNLSLYMSFSGIFNIFIGLLIAFMDSVDQEWSHIQMAIYIFITGYAFAKAAQKIERVVLDEKKSLAVEGFQKEREKEKKEEE